MRDFLEARLTEQPGSRVHRMVPWFTMFEPWAGHGADDVWRAFNYVHVINTFYHMYLISSKYSYSFLAEPVYYLKRACEYLDAMFTLWMFPDGVGATKFGNMGELILALRLEEALRKEGLISEAGRAAAQVAGLLSQPAWEMDDLGVRTVIMSIMVESSLVMTAPESSQILPVVILEWTTR